MSTIAVIAIIIGALILLALLYTAVRNKSRQRAFGKEQLRAQRDDVDHHRERAGERRVEAAVASERAKRAETEAELDEERAARRQAEIQS